MASRGVNKVILVGNLGQDPEVRYMPNGGAVANITLATSESWRDKQTGENKEITEWHRVVLFGKLAEVAGEYLKKGRRSISKASCAPVNGRIRVARSVIPPKSWLTLAVPCRCWAAVSRAVTPVQALQPVAARRAVAITMAGVSRSSRRATITSSVAARSPVRSRSHRARRPATTTNHQWISTTIFRSDSIGQRVQKSPLCGLFLCAASGGQLRPFRQNRLRAQHARHVAGDQQ